MYKKIKLAVDIKLMNVNNSLSYVKKVSIFDNLKESQYLTSSQGINGWQSKSIPIFDNLKGSKCLTFLSKTKRVSMLDNLKRSQYLTF